MLAGGILLYSQSNSVSYEVYEHVDEEVDESGGANQIEQQRVISDENQTDACEREMSTLFNSSNRSYARGSLLASFNDDVTREAAVLLVETAGGRADIEEGSVFEGWMNVAVDAGREVAVLCALREMVGVRGVAFNILFELHE